MKTEKEIRAKIGEIKGNLKKLDVSKEFSRSDLSSQMITLKWVLGDLQ